MCRGVAGLVSQRRTKRELEALLECAPRYGAVIRPARLGFTIPSDARSCASQRLPR
jgi:hypothetical protein